MFYLTHAIQYATTVLLQPMHTSMHALRKYRHQIFNRNQKYLKYFVSIWYQIHRSQEYFKAQALLRCQLILKNKSIPNDIGR